MPKDVLLGNKCLKILHLNIGVKMERNVSLTELLLIWPPGALQSGGKFSMQLTTDSEFKILWREICFHSGRGYQRNLCKDAHDNTIGDTISTLNDKVDMD